MSSLIALLVETAKTMGAEAAITAVVTKLKDGGIRKKVLEALPAQLAHLGIRGEQAHYVMGELSHPDALQRIGALTTVADIQAEVSYCLKLPDHFQVGDPKQAEGEWVTAALYLALLEVSRPGQYQSLVDQPKVKAQILEHLPTIGQAVQEQQQRRKTPVKMASEDISQVLVRAGQHEAQIEIGADGKLRLSGPFHLDFTASGENGKRMHEWLEQPQSKRLVLDATEGSCQLSLGHEELDRLFFPGEASQMIFELAPVERRAKLKVIGLNKSKFIDGTFTVLPHEKEIHLNIGNERCGLALILRSESEKPTTVNFHIHSDERPLPLRDAELLDTLKLFFTEGSRLQVLSWINPVTSEKEQPEHETVIFTMDQQLQEAERFRWSIHVHMLLLKVVHLISEAGFDPEELFLPDLPFAKAVEALQQILDFHHASGVGEKVQLTAVPTRSGYEQLQHAPLSLLRIGSEIGFGPVAVVCHREITDFQIVQAVEIPDADGVDVIVEGKWGEGEVRFLTPEQYQLEFGNLQSENE